VPVARLNELRRAALAALAAARAAQRPRRADHRSPVTGNACAAQCNAPAALDFHGNVLNERAAACYRAHGVTEIEPAAESGAVALHGRVVMTCKYCVRAAAGLCLRRAANAAAREPLYLVDDDGQRLRVVADCEKCQMALVLEAAV
jgi:hypothetical protein